MKGTAVILLPLAVLASTLFAPAVYSQVPQLVAVWGGPGTGPGQFYSPAGLGVDTQGNVYVADTDHHRIQVLRATDGALLREWGTYGTEPGQLEKPFAVAVATNGTVYVAEWEGNRIQMFTPAGDYVGQWGTYGATNKPLGRPDGVAIDPAGTVYVAHGYGIAKFTSTGTWIASWCCLDGEPFGRTYGVTVSPNGNILFTHDAGSGAVWEYTPGGQYVRQWGHYGMANGEFGLYTGGLAVDHLGNVYVADADNHRIQVFDASGQYLCQWGGLGTEPGRFYHPKGIAVDADGYVYVADTFNNRIQKFSPLAAGATRNKPETLGSLKAKYR